MRKLSHLGFCLVVLLGLNCITDYGIITDNNQVSGKKLGDTGGVQPVINTKGKAHIQESSQFAFVYPDGSDELMSFVDQASDGTAVLTTFNNFSTGTEPTFHDDLYCDTDRQGCSIFTAPDNNDANLFDGVFNANCSGARSLSALLATGRYYGECGRRERPKLDAVAKVRLLNAGQFATRYGMEGLLFAFDPSTTAVTVTDHTGYTELLPFSGTVTLWRHAGDNKSLVRLTDARFANTMTAYASWLERRDPEITTLTVEYHGIPVSFTLGQNKEQGMDYLRVLERANSAY